MGVWKLLEVNKLRLENWRSIRMGGVEVHIRAEAYWAGFCGSIYRYVEMVGSFLVGFI